VSVTSNGCLIGFDDPVLLDLSELNQLQEHIFSHILELLFVHTQHFIGVQDVRDFKDLRRRSYIVLRQILERDFEGEMQNKEIRK
jgi:hypothetical protein